MVEGYFRQDESYHWYFLPIGKVDVWKFEELIEAGEEGEDEFFELGYDEYMIDGNPSRYKVSIHESEL